MLDKSIEAYVLSLETINRLTVQYRLETFCYLLCNAWELLLKAKLIEDTGDEEVVFYGVSGSELRRSLSLKDCLVRLLPNENFPVRKNIDRVVELRDEAVHLVISEIPGDILGLLQACVVNYHRHLNEWFGESLAVRYPVPMMNIVYDMDPRRHDLTDSRLQARLGTDAFEFLSRFSAQLSNDRGVLGDADEFFVEVRYSTYITKRSSGADVSLTSGTQDGEPTQVVAVPKDPSTTHPYRQTEIKEQIQSYCPTANGYDVQSIGEVFGVKNRSDFFYQGKVPNSPGQYSQYFADWIKNMYGQNPRFFEETRAKKKELTQQRSTPYRVEIRASQH